MNLGGRGCSELRSHHCIPVWATRVKTYLKKKRKEMGGEKQFIYIGKIIRITWNFNSETMKARKERIKICKLLEEEKMTSTT